MLTTVRLVNTSSTAHNYHFVVVTGRTLRRCSISKSVQHYRPLSSGCERYTCAQPHTYTQTPTGRTHTFRPSHALAHGHVNAHTHTWAHVHIFSRTTTLTSFARAHIRTRTSSLAHVHNDMHASTHSHKHTCTLVSIPSHMHAPPISLPAHWLARGPRPLAWHACGCCCSHIHFGHRVKLTGSHLLTHSPPPPPHFSHWGSLIMGSRQTFENHPAVTRFQGKLGEGSVY